jgi:catalase
MFIPLNEAAYSPNTVNDGSPKQANETVGNGFFTAPGRTVNGHLLRATSPTFADVWSQPGLFYNSLIPAEQQFLINALRFELAHIDNDVIKNNFITQLNRVNNDIATRVAAAIGVSAPQPDPTYYHNNKTTNVGTFGTPLKKIDGLIVGVLASVNNQSSIDEAQTLSQNLASSNVDVIIVAERLASGVSATYSQSDATNFDSVIVTAGSETLFGPDTFTVKSNITLYPAGRPTQILVDAFRFGKPVGALGSAVSALLAADISTEDTGVVTGASVDDNFVNQLTQDLATFKFVDRFALDDN